MVTVQNLKGEIIQLILSRKRGGMYLVSATPTKLQAGVSLSEVTHSSSLFILCQKQSECDAACCIIARCNISPLIYFPIQLQGRIRISEVQRKTMFQNRIRISEVQNKYV